MKKRFLAFAPATVLIFGLMGCLSQSPSADGGTAAASSAANSAGGLATLRGSVVSAPDLTVTGEGLMKVINNNQAVDRNFEEQPPVVSHTVDEYPVTLKSNGCMDCHSRENAKKEKATVVPRSHFQTADGKNLPSISSRRHFCVQCHVPQVDAKPLVANTFQGPKQ
ncbi:MAG: nitrate reductase cytochrome c-type subunit [Azoarcus sp.]|jgi:cytochrome c-type protein NapB|nr:nitrate reductase cytochrome c-type subunit [Azoarcus sp.]